MYRSQGGNHLEQLEEFFDQGLIEDVLGLVKTGKEASVYCCKAGSMRRRGSRRGEGLPRPAIPVQE